MPEFFHNTEVAGDVHRVRMVVDEEEFTHLGFMGDPADAYTVLSLANVEPIMQRLDNHQRISVCTQTVLNSVEDKLSPENLYENMCRVRQLSPKDGGFRSLNKMDQFHLMFLHVWIGSKTKLPSYWLMPDNPNIDNIVSHPVVMRLRSVGVDPLTLFPAVAIIMDPRRFLDVDNPGSLEPFFSYLGLNGVIPKERVGVIISTLRDGGFGKVFNNHEFTISERVWAALTASWWYASPSEDGNGKKVNNSQYFMWELNEAIEASGIDRKDPLDWSDELVVNTINGINIRVATMLRTVWMDYVNDWKNFNPFAFFKDRGLAEQYNHVFPPGQS